VYNLEETSIKNKNALVTGSAKGIGSAIALRLAEKGARTVVNYKASQKEADDLVNTIQSAGGQAMAVQADVSDLSQVVAMLEEIGNIWGNIDILVNNAGIIRDGLLVRMSDDAWDDVINTNLNGTFYCTRAVLRSMLSKRWGRIINIGSVVGIRGNAGQSNYTASKSAIIGFGKALAKEVATRGITVNTVNPGYLETETTSILTQSQKDYWLSVIPQGRFGEVDDIAHLVAFLADDNAKYITGQVISVDGGMAV
jgi:3-oxoacyl-[acyl-carrier protein] reductase